MLATRGDRTYNGGPTLYVRLVLYVYEAEQGKRVCHFYSGPLHAIFAVMCMGVECIFRFGRGNMETFPNLMVGSRKLTNEIDRVTTC